MARGEVNVRQALLFSVIALGISALNIQGAQAACNVRGEFCGYPGWAANAFSNPRDRVPDWDLDNPTNRSAADTPPRKYRAKRHRDRTR